jgi:hypothetical protein
MSQWASDPRIAGSARSVVGISLLQRDGLDLDPSRRRRLGQMVVALIVLRFTRAVLRTASNEQVFVRQMAGRA